jgi:hypothetical protein
MEHGCTAALGPLEPARTWQDAANTRPSMTASNCPSCAALQHPHRIRSRADLNDAARVVKSEIENGTLAETRTDVPRREWQTSFSDLREGGAPRRHRRLLFQVHGMRSALLLVMRNLSRVRRRLGDGRRPRSGVRRSEGWPLSLLPAQKRAWKQKNGIKLSLAAADGSPFARAGVMTRQLGENFCVCRCSRFQRWPSAHVVALSLFSTPSSPECPTSVSIS